MADRLPRVKPLKIDTQKYPPPTEMPDMLLEDDGVFRVDFGTILITPEHIMHAVAAQHLMAPGRRPILAIGESATETRGRMLEVGREPQTISVTSALALVTRGRVANMLGNAFMMFQENPYPTRLFNDENTARAWLRTHL